MYARIPGLGLIPSWQFDMSAANPKINPHVVYPDGVTQETTQPLGPNWGVSGIFDSPVWEYRKAIVGGGLALAAIGIGAILFKTLR